MEITGTHRCLLPNAGTCAEESIELFDVYAMYLKYLYSIFSWVSMNDPFNFDTDLDKGLLCDAIAREQWTKELWSKLRE